MTTNLSLPAGIDPGAALLASLTVITWLITIASVFGVLPPLHPFLLLLPAVLLAYRYQKRGVAVAGGFAIAYLLLLLLSGVDLPAIVGGGVAAVMIVAAAAAVAYPSFEAEVYGLWYQAVYHRSGEAILFFYPETGALHDANPAAGALLGYPLEDLLQRPFTSFCNGNPNLIATVRELPQRKQVYEAEDWFAGRDGRLYLRYSLAMITEGLAICRLADRTAERHALDRLTGKEENERRLLDTLPATAGILFDEDLRVSAAGGRALSTLVGPADLVGKTLWEGFPHTLAAPFEPLFRAALTGREAEAEVTAGEEVYLVRTAPVVKEDWTISGGVASITGITALRGEGKSLQSRSVKDSVLVSLLQEGKTKRELCSEVLAALLSQTDSAIGYIAFPDQTGTRLSIAAWSEGVMKGCALQDGEFTWTIADMGLWGVPARDRLPVIVNAYQGQLPKGHLPLQRYLGVPLVRDDRLIAVAGVANSPVPYTDGDTDTARELLAALDQALVMRRRTDEQGRELAAYQAFFTRGPFPAAVLNQENEILHANQAFVTLVGRREGTILDLVQPADLGRTRTFLENARIGQVSGEAGIECRLQRPDGHHDLYCQASGMADRELLLVMVEITAERRAAEARRLIAAELRRLTGRELTPDEEEAWDALTAPARFNTFQDPDPDLLKRRAP
ncbi:GAF domain-containing protein [Methanosphaerula subterraneus]|uniref:GAF domain-containing protein n=1 Tax=Methanosphaerula subterraneus TaxID=3350244 RepID=UPI003F836059